MDWIVVAQDRDWRQAVVSTVMDLWVPSLKQRTFIDYINDCYFHVEGFSSPWSWFRSHS